MSLFPKAPFAEDGAEHTARELRQRIGDDLGLTDAKRKELLPSGTQPVFTNRLAWARAHLTMVGLLEKTGKERFRIRNAAKKQWLPIPRPSTCDSFFRPMA